jgi:cytoskeletal protein CcmA (bactofilin family)
MSDLRVRSLDEDEIGTILSVDVEFDGELEFEHPVLVRGQVRGEIKSSDDVFISEEALVSGVVEANRVSVKGRLDASVRASHRIELFRTARVSGDVWTPDLIVQSGARYNGRCTMADSQEETPHA